MNLMHHCRLSLQFESSQEPNVSNKTDPALALGHKTVHALQLLHADRRAQYARPGWVNTQRLLRTEQAPAVAAPNTQAEQHLISREWYIRVQVAPKIQTSAAGTETGHWRL